MALEKLASDTGSVADHTHALPANTRRHRTSIYPIAAGIKGMVSVKSAHAILMPLVRRELWPPDGKPPDDWDERREGSVLKRLLMHRSVSQIEAAIIGLAKLRDTCQVEWLKPGEKCTTRCLYNTRYGMTQMFELATQWFWHEARKDAPKRMQSLGQVLNEAMRKAKADL